MSALLILVIAIVLLALGYVFYGSWLAKQWGVDPDRDTPSHTSYDGKDFVPADPAILMGHHFSSIAGAGPINGPIQAAVFGWVPVFLWCVLGGIFVGGVHDFGALFASVRHNGGSVGEIIKDTMGTKAQRLFLVFALVVLILSIASLTSVTVSTFEADYVPAVNDEGNAITEFADGTAYFTRSGLRYLPVESGSEFEEGMAYFVANGGVISTGHVAPNASTAMTSVLFILLAYIFGFFVYRKNFPIGLMTLVGLVGIVLIVWLGMKLGLNFSRTIWVLLIAVYVTVAALLPVWKLLQPRDYLSSFLLYGMMLLAVVAIVGATFTGTAFLKDIPAFYGWKNPAGQPLFPFLFITVACGACSGFHSLISSGTSSKQINNEKDAQIIGYGSMVIESALGVIALIAIGVVWNQTSAGGGEKYLLSAPPTIFAGGIATMFASFAGEGAYGVIYNLFTLAVSVFALTTLDSATRLCRYLFETQKDLTGAAKFFATPLVSTLIMVIIGCGMGFMELKQIWSVFGSANQLLAAIAMLAVCAWLGKIGRNNKMFYVPMVFMLCATITALGFTVFTNVGKIGGGAADWSVWFQTICSLALIVLAVVLAAMSFKTLSAQGKKNADTE